MRVFLFSLLLTLSACGSANTANDNLPTYKTIVEKFFSSYHFTPPNYSFEEIAFAKKKDGWHVMVKNLQKNKIEKSELFWSLDKKQFVSLQKFDKGGSAKEVEEKLYQYLLGDNAYNAYGYERCRYFGYDGWDADMIHDFGNATPANDTLFEGLARAHGSYAAPYVLHQSGQNDATPATGSRAPLGPLEKPNAERVALFNQYMDKSIQYCEELVKRNPSYRTKTGNAAMKLMNQRMYKWQMLMNCGESRAAQQVITAITDNDEMYRQIGHLYLQDCPPNAILFTYGDTDTYPLWYVQAKEGFRKDVTVLNNSLLNLPAYLDMLKKTNAVEFSTTAEQTTVEAHSYFRRDGSYGQVTKSLAEFINECLSITQAGTAHRVMSAKREIDIASVKWTTDRPLNPDMSINPGDLLFLGNFITLDIVNSNFEKRPICFTTDTEIWHDKLKMKGLYYQLLPLKETEGQQNTQWEIQQLTSYINEHYKPLFIKYGAETEEATRGLHRSLFEQVMMGYHSLGDMEKAKEWGKKYLAHPATQTAIGDGASQYFMVVNLFEVGLKTEAVKLAEQMADSLLKKSNQYSAIQYYDGPAILRILQYYYEKGIRSEKLDHMITELKKS